jgi:hypothetical protein
LLGPSRSGSYAWEKKYCSYQNSNHDSFVVKTAEQ